MTERFDVVVGAGPGGYVADFRKPSTGWPDR
jgi:pyruvate/2-oxoglutarate dehydrogenase complex dihydrolipoamide dehydrogenase (E3) component